MPAKVDRAIEGVMESTGLPKGRAIAILKSRGMIKQKGRHLEATEKLKGRKKKR